MAKFENREYFIPVSTTHSCNFIACVGHTEEINRIISYHTVYEIMFCLLFEREAICKM